MTFFWKQILLKKSKANSNESGFTIIESLIAIVVVAILMSAIAPVIVFSTATRIQARRVEKATQAAKSFIDALRTEKIDSSKIKNIEVNASTSASQRKLPSSSRDYLIDTNEMQLPTNTNDLYCFNKDSTFGVPGCTSDLFYIQTARITVINSEQPEDGYRLAIRIYRHDTEFNKIKQQDEYRQKQSTATAGIGSRLRPLLVMNTDITNDDTSFEALCKRLGSTSGKCS